MFYMVHVRLEYCLVRSVLWCRFLFIFPRQNFINLDPGKIKVGTILAMEKISNSYCSHIFFLPMWNWNCKSILDWICRWKKRVKWNTYCNSLAQTTGVSCTYKFQKTIYIRCNLFYFLCRKFIQGQATKLSSYYGKTWEIFERKVFEQ
jgi:hypothetical protein